MSGKPRSFPPTTRKQRMPAAKWAMGLAVQAAAMVGIGIASDFSWRLTALACAHFALLFALVRTLETRCQAAQAINQKIDELRSRLNH
jgi:hypothetical protein